jgi:hypothetical protein
MIIMSDRETELALAVLEDDGWGSAITTTPDDPAGLDRLRAGARARTDTEGDA